MPDQRRHRGPHPQDLQLFATGQIHRLRRATRELAWLSSRGYPGPSSLKLVGDRYALTSRQRLATSRCAASYRQICQRRSSQLTVEEIIQQRLWIDGYNVLTSIEAALSGGVILHAHDGCFRDLASMHGSYRRVAETVPAIELLGSLLEHWGVQQSHWLLDSPVSNSGKLKGLLTEISVARGWDWVVELVPDPDRALMSCRGVVASADSQILDSVQRWFNLARSIIEVRIPDAFVIDLSF